MTDATVRAALDAFPRLARLDLGGTQVTDALADALARGLAPGLAHLTLGDSPVSADARARLEAARPDLQLD